MLMISEAKQFKNSIDLDTFKHIYMDDICNKYFMTYMYITHIWRFTNWHTDRWSWIYKTKLLYNVFFLSKGRGGCATFLNLAWNSVKILNRALKFGIAVVFKETTADSPLQPKTDICSRLFSAFSRLIRRFWIIWNKLFLWKKYSLICL